MDPGKSASGTEQAKTDSSTIARRGVLAALGLGGLATLGTNSASAQAAGQVGTASNPIDVFGYGVVADNSFTDPAGVEHTGELADASDVGSGGGLAGDLLGDWGHHTQYADALSNEEISRITLPAGESLEVHRLEAALKGGGTDSNVVVELFDQTNTTLLASVTGGSQTAGDPIATSGTGATIVIRVSTPSSGTPAFAFNGDTRVV